MFGFVLGILVIILGLTVGAALRKDRKVTGAAVMVLLPLLGAVLILSSCVTSVPAGHTGVVTTFGRVENFTLDSGMHLVMPWQKVVKMDNRIQKQTTMLPCFSSDIQEVEMLYTVNYQIRKSDAMTIYRTIGVDYYNTVITPSVAEAVKVATARYTAEELVSQRSELAEAIEAVLSEKLLPYNIELVATSIENMDFTDAFTDAVEAKQVAQQNKLRVETEAEQKVVEAEAAAHVKKVQAEAEAEAQKIAADAQAYEIGVRADAEAEANRKIAESLTRELIDYTYASAWDGELPTVVTGSDSAAILDVSKMVE